MEVAGRGVFPNKPTLPTGLKKRPSPSPQTLLPAAVPLLAPARLLPPPPHRHARSGPRPRPAPAPAPAAAEPPLDLQPGALLPLPGRAGAGARALLHAAPVPPGLPLLPPRRAPARRRPAVPAQGARALRPLGVGARAPPLGARRGRRRLRRARDGLPCARPRGPRRRHLRPARRNAASLGSRLDVRAYTTVLHALSREGRYERALQLFDELRCEGVEPTRVTYNGKMGRSWPRIVALLEEMRAAGVEPHGFTTSTVIAACGRDGLINEAVAFFEDLKDHGHAPCVVTYNSLLQVFGKAGNYTEALRVLKEMEESGCKPDAVTYNELAGSYARAGFCEEAAKCLDTMVNRGILPNAFTYNTIMTAYGNAGKVRRSPCSTA